MTGNGDVLHVAWLGHRSPKLAGGMATYSQEITSGLRSRGHHVTFFTLKSADDGHQTDPSLETVGLEAMPLLRPLVISGPRAKRTLVDRLTAHDFDLVHASFWFSSLDFDLPKTCRRLGIPLVATFHVAFDNRVSVWGGITNATYRLYAPTLAQCDRVIVFGEAQRDLLATLGVPRQVLRILPNGVDVERYAPGPSDWKSRLGEAGQLFVYMGRVDSEKGVDALLHAFLAVDPPASTRLVVVGHGSERRRLQRQYRDSRVIFTGHLADADERIGILRAADAFFLPSQVEGLSLSMLEAMACGLATVATDVGGDGDALRGAGILIDPSSLDEQLEGVLRMLIDLPWLGPPLGEAARRRVLERFSLTANIDTLVDLYREVAR
ncbi:MAG TPA: glycosyltransferase family 4 protein [Candidatus Dormibacteraeota bacterium]|jgi:glycosyltransferase involved in cell wall biosynthesis